MLSCLKKSIVEKSIFYERVRTLLYISMFKNINIWLVLQKPDEYLNSAKIISGVVDYLLNGTDREPFHKKYIGGVVYFRNNKQPYNMAEIVATSYHPISDVHEPYNKTREDTLNTIQHLVPWIGFSEGNNTERHYYKILSEILK